MIDEHDVREMLQHRAQAVAATPTDPPRAIRRARRRLVLNGAVVTVMVVAIAWVALARIEAPTATVPADPTRELGIFTPLAGQILVESTDDFFGGWVDPDGPVGTTQGQGVAGGLPASAPPDSLDAVGWSSDGTQMLLLRSDGDALFPKYTLSMLHADGTETPVTREPIFEITDATMSPDGSLVLFKGDGELDASQLLTVDGEGRPVPFPIPGADPNPGLPTFSPDGSQIAFVAGGRKPTVWVANADGTGAHRILADAPIDLRVVTGLSWSPRGDLLAMGIGEHETSRGSIYTFAPDGSDLTKVIALGSVPFWSPDGSRIAYTIRCDSDSGYSCAWFDAKANPPGLAIADADGTHVKEFGYGVSGPWFPFGDAAASSTAGPPSSDGANG